MVFPKSIIHGGTVRDNLLTCRLRIRSLLHSTVLSGTVFNLYQQRCLFISLYNPVELNDVLRTRTLLHTIHLWQHSFNVTDTAIHRQCNMHFLLYIPNAMLPCAMLALNISLLHRLVCSPGAESVKHAWQVALPVLNCTLISIVSARHAQKKLFWSPQTPLSRVLLSYSANAVSRKGRN